MPEGSSREGPSQSVTGRTVGPSARGSVEGSDGGFGHCGPESTLTTTTVRGVGRLGAPPTVTVRVSTGTVVTFGPVRGSSLPSTVGVQTPGSPRLVFTARRQYPGEPASRMGGSW